MALPYNILNGAVPDATPLMANFNYLDARISAFAAIKTGLTFNGMKTFAALTPTQAFTCIPTDMKAWLLYCGEATAGQNADGFITLTSWETIS